MAPISGRGSARTERDATTIKTTDVAQTRSVRVLARVRDLCNGGMLLTAKGIYRDGSKQSVSAGLTWASSQAVN
jgi:hypothetical protein